MPFQKKLIGDSLFVNSANMLVTNLCLISPSAWGTSANFANAEIKYVSRKEIAMLQE